MSGYALPDPGEPEGALTGSPIGGLVVRMRGNLTYPRKAEAGSWQPSAPPDSADLHQAVGSRPWAERRPSAPRCIATISPLPGKTWLRAVTTT